MNSRAQLRRRAATLQGRQQSSSANVWFNVFGEPPRTASQPGEPDAARAGPRRRLRHVRTVRRGGRGDRVVAGVRQLHILIRLHVISTYLKNVYFLIDLTVIKLELYLECYRNQLTRSGRRAIYIIEYGRWPTGRFSASLRARPSRTTCSIEHSRKRTQRLFLIF